VPSLITLFRRRVETEGDQTALHVKRAGKFVAVTWNEFALDVRRTAAVLVALGVQPGDRVAHVSPNRYEWIVIDLAVLMARAVHVPMHSTLSWPQVVYQVRDCEPRVVILADPSPLEKPDAEPLPDDVTVLKFDASGFTLTRSASEEVPRLSLGRAEEQGTAMEQDALNRLSDDDLATILYTSGTTGEPKGVMLTHGNLRTNAESTLAVFGSEPGDVMLNWLPLSHVYARTCDEYVWLAAPRMELALAESRDTIIADCQAVRPTSINSVPYFYDKLYRHLTETGQADKPGSVAGLLGGRMRTCCAGGAALPNHVAEFFNRQGIRLLQGYGLTESSPVISFSTDPTKVGSCGRPIPGVEVRIASDGELLTRGPHVMQGYWKKPEETARTIIDGWLHTGDLARIDDDGYIYITGRKKELIVTASGKNIAPVLIEGLLTEDPLIRQAMVIGDGRNYLTALIVVDQANLEAELARLGVECAAEQRLTNSQVHDIFAERIAARLSRLSCHEQIGQFTLLAQPFTIDREELTPTLKLRRNVVAEHYRAEIEAMYSK
jgi:long-chain acyl-CoA synthetase